jgi:hypothetical protein
MMVIVYQLLEVELILIADTSLSLSIAGIQVSTTYKSEFQQLKNDTEFKTQAQAAKTGADISTSTAV